jgi:protein ImuB
MSEDRKLQTSNLKFLTSDFRLQTSGSSRCPCYACVFVPPVTGQPVSEPSRLLEIAQGFSPRYERHRDDLISIDVTGLERFIGSRVYRVTGAQVCGGREPVNPSAREPEWRAIGEELMRAADAKGTRAHVALASTRMAALILAHARPGVTIVAPGEETAALVTVPIAVLTRVADCVIPSRQTTRSRTHDLDGPGIIALFTQWALRTLGELAALPADDLTARIGPQASVWQAIARGEDVRPLVPTEPEERFAGSLELEWPIDGLEPLSFVLTRLLEPLSTQLERRDRGAAVLHITLDLVTRGVHARHLELPSPIRDVRTLRTLALLDIEAHPPAAAIDRITVVIDPTPGRIVQHTLFTRALPTPEQLSTLLARLGAVMGQDRIGAPALVDTYRPGAFVMRPFATEHRPQSAVASPQPSTSGFQTPSSIPQSPSLRSSVPSSSPASALRRCRQPVPARVVVKAGQPVRVTSDRRGYPGGSVVAAAGPWRTSGDWWEDSGRVGMAGEEGKAGKAGRAKKNDLQGAFVSLPLPASLPTQPNSPWKRTEWDVSLSDGAMYRVFHDELHDGWFIDGIFD